MGVLGVIYPNIQGDIFTHDYFTDIYAPTGCPFPPTPRSLFCQSALCNQTPRRAETAPRFSETESSKTPRELPELQRKCFNKPAVFGTTAVNNGRSATLLSVLSPALAEVRPSFLREGWKLHRCDLTLRGAERCGPAHLHNVYAVIVPRALQVPLPQAGELHQHVPSGGKRHHVCGRSGRRLRADVHQQRRPRPTGALFDFSVSCRCLWRT